MTTLTFDKATIQTDNNEVWLALRLPYESRQAARRFALDMKEGKRYTAELKQFREKRSKNANNYCWALLTELSEAVGVPSVELYRNAVRDIAPYKDFTLTPDEAKTLQVAWGRLGIGWQTEQVDFTPDGERVVIRAYYGSSTYTTKRMARLIESIVQDCKAVGIDTLSERERSLLLEDWDAQRDKGDGDTVKR